MRTFIVPDRSGVGDRGVYCRRAALSIAAAFLSLAARAGVPEASAFLAAVRQPSVEPAWAQLSGEVRHKRSGERSQTRPIDLRLRLGREGVAARLTFAKAEVYQMQQIYADGLAGTKVEQLRPGNGLAAIGLRPGDLTLSFLYWDLLAELPADAVRGIACRVFRLQHPETREQAVVAISTKHLFPIRVEWFEPGGKTSRRYLTFTAFERSQAQWFVKKAYLAGDGWKSILEFDHLDAGITAETPEPADLFPTLD